MSRTEDRISAGRKRAVCGYGKSVFVGGKNLRGSGFAYKNTGEEKILARNSLFAAVSVYCAAITVTGVGELCPYTPFASAVTVICEPTPRPLILNVSAEV